MSGLAILQSYAQKNALHVSLVLFMIGYFVFIKAAPTFAFDGSKPRPFGIGRKRSTVMPVWLFVIACAALSYALVTRMYS